MRRLLILFSLLSAATILHAQNLKFVEFDHDVYTFENGETIIKATCTGTTSFIERPGERLVIGDKGHNVDCAFSGELGAEYRRFNNSEKFVGQNYYATRFTLSGRELHFFDFIGEKTIRIDHFKVVSMKHKRTKGQ